MKSICLLPFVLASVLGSTTRDYVHRTPIRAVGRPVITYTPQITEVRPELRVYDVEYDVHVPKPVYDTEYVTPVEHRYVSEPYPVPKPYSVPQPYAVPEPYPVPVPVYENVHVQHHVTAVPAPRTYGRTYEEEAPHGYGHH